MLCKCHWIVLYTVHFTAFCLGGPFFPGHGVEQAREANKSAVTSRKSSDHVGIVLTRRWMTIAWPRVRENCIVCVHFSISWYGQRCIRGSSVHVGQIRQADCRYLMMMTQCQIGTNTTWQMHKSAGSQTTHISPAEWLTRQHANSDHQPCLQLNGSSYLTVKTAPSINTFRWHLKTYLFSTTTATY